MFEFLLVFLSLLTVSCQKKASPASNQQIFTTIYEEGLWGKNNKGEGYSGEGSDVASAKPYMEFLAQFLREKGIKSVIDIGCGDWEFSQHMDWRGIQYCGIDVVKSVIEKNQRAFGNSEISFFCADAVSKKLPKADLLICKDVLQHLPLKDIFALSKQFANFKYCLITNDIENPFSIIKVNGDLPVAGGCRPLDLAKPPFSFQVKKVLSYAAPTCGKESIKEVILIEN